MAVEVLAPTVASEPQNAELTQAARAHASAAKEAAFNVAFDLPDAWVNSAKPSLEAFVGPMALRSLEGARKRGWVATEHIEAGALLLVEHLSFPLVGGGPGFTDASGEHVDSSGDALLSLTLGLRSVAGVAYLAPATQKKRGRWRWSAARRAGLRVNVAENSIFVSGSHRPRTPAVGGPRASVSTDAAHGRRVCGAASLAVGASAPSPRGARYAAASTAEIHSW